MWRQVLQWLMTLASRLIFASARDHFLPSAFAKLHYSRRTPDNAMALNAALTIFFVCFGGGFRCRCPSSRVCPSSWGRQTWSSGVGCDE